MHPSFYQRPLFLLLIIYMVCLAFFYKPAPAKKDVSRFTGQTVTVCGRVESFAITKPHTNNVLLRVHAVNAEEADGLLYVRLENFEPLWKDEIELTGLIKTPFGADLLGNFNWRTYLTYKHVFSEVKTNRVRVVRQAQWYFRWVRTVRRSMLDTFEHCLPRELVPLAAGILLGERSDLNPAVFTAFQDSGAIHLLVASGGNVGFVTLLVLMLGSWCGISRKKDLVGALVVAGFYTLLAGADAPLVRAYFMTVCAVLGYLLGRNSGVFQGLVISCFVILLFTPAALFETGFQMSFLATLAIVLCVGNFPLPQKWPKALKFFVQIFLITLAVQLALLPIFTNVFYKISVAGLVANMVLVPFASWLLGLSFAYYLAEVLHVGFLLYFPTVWSLSIFQKLVVFFASFSFSSVSVTAWQPTTIAAYFIGLFFVFNWPLKPLIRKTWIVGAVLILGMLAYSFYNHQRIRIALLDQYGTQTVLVRTPSKQVFVFGTSLKPEQLKNALYAMGVTRVTGEFGFSAKKPKEPLTGLMPVSSVVFPFADAWPGDIWTFKDTSVLLAWGFRRGPDGSLTQVKGYSGTKQDEISYCITVKQTHFCLGGNGRFIWQENGRFVFSKRNQTILHKI